MTAGRESDVTVARAYGEAEYPVACSLKIAIKTTSMMRTKMAIVMTTKYTVQPVASGRI